MPGSGGVESPGSDLYSQGVEAVTITVILNVSLLEGIKDNPVIATKSFSPEVSIVAIQKVSPTEKDWRTRSKNSPAKSSDALRQAVGEIREDSPSRTFRKTLNNWDSVSSISGMDADTISTIP